MSVQTDKNIWRFWREMQVFVGIIAIYLMKEPGCLCDKLDDSGSNGSQPINVTSATCFVRNLNDIYWTVVVSKLSSRERSGNSNVRELPMYLQTKNEYQAFADWFNTTDCTLDDQDVDRKSLTCRIVKPMHYRNTDAYALRLLVLSNDELQHVRTISITHSQPYDGFPCYPNHAIHNLSHVRISETSVRVTWDLNPWDRSFVYGTALLVYYDGELDRQMELSVQSRQRQYATIRGLEPQREYQICIVSLMPELSHNSRTCLYTGTNATATTTSTLELASSSITTTLSTQQHSLDNAVASHHSRDKTGKVVGFLVGFFLVIVFVYVGVRMTMKGLCVPGSVSWVIRWPCVGGEAVDDGVALLSHPFTVATGVHNADDEDAVFV